MSELGSLEAIDNVYAERNAVVMGFATLAILSGWQTGQADSGDPEWPIVLIDTPHGQVSWHVKANDLPEGFPPYPGEWDGHTTEEKHRRLRRFVHLGKRGTQDDTRAEARSISHGGTSDA